MTRRSLLLEDLVHRSLLFGDLLLVAGAAADVLSSEEDFLLSDAGGDAGGVTGVVEDILELG